mgnify:CR=1 FL=1
MDGEHAVVDAVPLLNGVVEGADEGLVGLVDGAVADLDVLVALLGQLEVDADEPAQLLAEGERINEIARMASGSDITAAALDNAREMVDNARIKRAEISRKSLK